MADSVAKVRPVNIQVRKEEGEMVIEWAGGARTRLDLELLRRNCPCATCTGKRDQEASEAGLHVLSDEDLETTADVDAVIPVGRYAIQIRWADGHDTGIYTYDHLRRLGGAGAEEEGT